jgi:hypothetical protein
MSCLADYLSHKRSMAPIPGWKVRPPLEPEEQIELALVSSRHENSNVRAYIGRTLRQADARILSDPRIVDALVAMKNDPEPDVRVAASWSSRR